MKYFFNLLFTLLCNISFAQTILIAKQDLMRTRSNIENILEQVKNGQSSVLYDISTLNINTIREVNRKQFPIEWEYITTEKVKIYLFTLNELGNYIDYSTVQEIKYLKLIIPPCYKDTSFIQYPHQPTIEEIEDDECKKIFLKLINEREKQKKRNEYLQPIYIKYSRLVQDLVTMFEWSEYSSVKDLNQYLQVFEVQYFDSPQKLEYFKALVKNFSYGKN